MRPTKQMLHMLAARQALLAGHYLPTTTRNHYNSHSLSTTGFPAAFDYSVKAKCL